MSTLAGLPTTPTMDGIADTVVAAGVVTTPAANAAIATIAAPGAGSYTVRVRTRMSGTAETGVTNLELRHGSTVVGKVAITSLTDVQEVVFPKVTILAAEAISVNATALATTGAIYNVIVTATQVS